MKNANVSDLSNIMDEIRNSRKAVTVRTLVDQLRYPKVHPNPIIQRMSAVAAIDNKKSAAIIECIFANISVGEITMRDISEIHDPRNEARIRKLYPGYTGLCIDGGHRLRAIRDFVNDLVGICLPGSPKVAVYWSDLTLDQQTKFLDTEMAVNYVLCSSKNAGVIFKALNQGTAVKRYEHIMADENSYYCEVVRKITRTYKEYGKEPTAHALFTISYDPKVGESAKYFDSPNERGNWWWFAFATLMKVMGNGNVHCGPSDAEELIESETVNTKLSSAHDNLYTKFFDDTVDFQESCFKHISDKTRLCQKYFFVFQSIWFELLSNHKVFVFDWSSEGFAYNLKTAVAQLEGSDRLETLPWGTKKNPKRAMRSEIIKKFPMRCDKPDHQIFVANLVLKAMGIADISDKEALKNVGVTVRDKVRGPKTSKREQALLQQKGVCAIAADVCPRKGKKMKLSECEFGHDLAYADGGTTSDGAAICIFCNGNMGKRSFAQYEADMRNRKCEAA